MKDWLKPGYMPVLTQLITQLRREPSKRDESVTPGPVFQALFPFFQKPESL